LFCIFITAMQPKTCGESIFYPTHSLLTELLMYGVCLCFVVCKILAIQSFLYMYCIQILHVCFPIILKSVVTTKQFFSRNAYIYIELL